MTATAVLEQEDLKPEHEPVTAGANDQMLLEEIQELLKRARGEVDARNRPKLVGYGQEIELPEPIFRLLRQIVPHLMKGHALTLVPLRAELSTQQAADLLNVSRPFLIGLLERGEIPYVKTGKHRRIKYGDLMAYKKQRDATRRTALDRLTELSQEAGLDAYQD